MSSDVCKHCTHAACLDVCPTGALFRTEFGTVVVQEDVCNGCGYCVPACPFGVIDRRERQGVPGEGARQQVHALLRPPQGRIDPGVCQGMPDRVDPVRPARRAPPPRGGSARRACRRPATRARACTARARTTASAASARSSCCSTSPRSTACRRIRWRRRATLPEMWRSAGKAALLLAASVALATFGRRR